MRLSQLIILLNWIAITSPNHVNYCSKWVTVQTGDSCWQIATSVGIQIDSLKSMNPKINCDALWIGPKICTVQSSNKPECTKEYIVKSGDYCYKIWRENDLSEQQLKDMNDNLNCNSMIIGQTLCVSWDEKHGSLKMKTAAVETITAAPEMSTTTLNFENSTLENNEHPPLPLVESAPECSEYNVVKNGDTCYSIALEFHLNLTEVQNSYDCDHLKIGDTMCISKNFTCQHRYLIRNGDSCHSIGGTFKLDPKEIEAMNDKLSCENLEVGRRICVWPAERRVLSNINCAFEKIADEETTCMKIANQHSITIDELKLLNPTISCEQNIQKSISICIRSASSPRNCSSIHAIPNNFLETCSNLAQRFSMSVPLLLNLNPTLDCGKLNRTDQVCIGIGSFKSSECTDFVRIDPTIDSCEKVQNATGLIMDQLLALNPFINCNESLKFNTLVCTANLGMETKTAQEIVVSKLKDLVPDLAEKFEKFLKNPSETNSVILNELMMSSIQKPKVNARMKDLYKLDDSFRTILDNQHPLPRQTYCDQVKKTNTTQVIKSCFCENDELLMYCQALAVQRYQDNERRLMENETLQRSKRAVSCNFVTPSSGETVLDVMKASKQTCWGGQCSIPIGFFEASLEGNLCFPTVEILRAGDRFLVCLNQKEDCSTTNPNDIGALKLLVRRSVDSSLKLCAIGSNLIKKLLAADAGLCFDIVSVNYYGLVGKLNIGSSLNLIALKLSGGATIKVHDLAFPNICDDVEMECEDYCKWRGWPNGRAYGNIEGRLFSVFGWKGVKIFEESFNEPSKLGCQVGEKAAVILRNDRTCENPGDRDVWRCCWSGDDNKCTFELMDGERGFSFKPHIFGRTLFVCEFIDKYIENEKIGFDVYGGTSSNHGERNFYYVAKNDGMYFGTVKYKEDKLIKSWKHPCLQAKQSEVDRTGQTETSGQSSVPAASCGKRIVGYYTGWGDREITENQLRKLTHVVFAFVAMKSDGTVDFGPVSPDDPSVWAGVKAKRRFLEMKEKARTVHCGVKILFAVGGWDNSQYFSSTVADPGPRSVFINSVVKFIETYGIDGVDLDWEYPAENGGDKNNHVALVRELRQKLDEMANSNGRSSKYLITLATAAGEWNLREGYDLNGILQYADFLNVMTYDYYGAWASKWGAYTGPPSPLYYGNLKGFSGKLNADFSMKFYACQTNKKLMLNMGVPFYGRFWKNVEDPIRGEDGMWRTAQEVGGKFEGGYVAWRNLESQGWNKGATTWHEKTKTPYIFNSAARMFLGFENERSLQEKMNYAIEKNLGGIMIWAIDLDDDADTLLNLVSNTNLCSGGGGGSSYSCNPINDVRWWTPENSDESIQGQCGKSAKLINGYYPVCDPDDPGFSCCGAAGYCGSEEEYCGCKTCVDYRKNPMDIIKVPVRPSREVQWYSMSDPDGKRGRCGKYVPMLNGKMALCNPDDDSKHCCSNGGYCGTGKEYCECDGCVDFRKNS